MSVDDSQLRDAIHDLGLRAVDLGAQRFVELKRQDASWSTRVTDAIQVDGILDAGSTIVASVTVQEVTLDDGTQGDLGGWHDQGIEAHPIDPVNAQVLHWEADGEHVFARHVDWPGTTVHQGWWSDELEPQAEQALTEGLEAAG